MQLSSGFKRFLLVSFVLILLAASVLIAWQISVQNQAPEEAAAGGSCSTYASTCQGSPGAGKVWTCQNNNCVAVAIGDCGYWNAGGDACRWTAGCCADNNPNSQACIDGINDNNCVAGLTCVNNKPYKDCGCDVGACEAACEPGESENMAVCSGCNNPFACECAAGPPPSDPPGPTPTPEPPEGCPDTDAQFYNSSLTSGWVSGQVVTQANPNLPYTMSINCFTSPTTLLQGGTLTFEGPGGQIYSGVSSETADNQSVNQGNGVYTAVCKLGDEVCSEDSFTISSGPTPTPTPTPPIEDCGDGICNQSSEYCEASNLPGPAIECTNEDLTEQRAPTGDPVESCSAECTISEGPYCGNGICEEGETCEVRADGSEGICDTEGGSPGTEDIDCRVEEGICEPEEIEEGELTIIKSSDEVCLDDGDHQINYRITVTNIGAQLVEYTQITDTIDSRLIDPQVSDISDNGVLAGNVITWPGGSLEPGGSKVYSYSLIVFAEDDAEFVDSPLVNVVTVIYNPDDPQERSYTNTQPLVCSELPETAIEDYVMYFVALGLFGIAVIIYRRRYGYAFLDSTFGQIKEISDKLIDYSFLTEKRGGKTFEKEILDRHQERE